MQLGNELVAFDLFCGALQSKLNNALQANLPPDETIMRAESHILNFCSHVAASRNAEGIIRHPVVPKEEHGSDEELGVPLQSRGYEPFLIQEAFMIPDNASTQLACSTIVFNLGLLHHSACRTSQRAAEFYEISSGLLAMVQGSSATLPLRIALLTNFGVWCYEMGIGGPMRSCMEHLEESLREVQPVDSPTHRGLSANIRELLIPSQGASPAA